MTRLRDLPIQRKLTFGIVLTCVAALSLACGAFVAYDVAGFRREIVEHIESLAGVTGLNTTAALEFNDARSAADTLSSLRSEPKILAAFVYDRSGGIFATYRQAGAPAAGAPAPLAIATHVFTPDQLRLFRPIVSQGEVIGTIALVADLTALSRRISRYAIIVALVFAMALLLVFLLSRYFERLITKPILNLAALTRAVAVGKDYSGRASKESNDEIGQLIDGFNHMLAQIEERDAELQQAHALLERRVEERTAALQHAQAEAAREHARFKFIFDTVPVGISLVEVRSGVPVARLLNDAHRRICGLTPAQAAADGAGERLSHPADYERQQMLDQQMAAGAIHQFSLEKRYLTPDGRTVWVVYSVQRRNDGHGNHEDLSTLVDITGRKQAETEREALNRQLLEISRKAGMAEVATGVLHNVGNVLNSVNVSATLVADQLRTSRLGLLTRLCGLLREHEADLVAFLTEDPKGRHVAGFLETLAAQLAAEQTQLGQEVESLRANIEHIKEIVAMQQSYAQVSGVTETVAVSDLVEDALRMNAGALSRHGVELQRDFPALPAITVDKHKVLQILVNFIRNAKYACSESGRPDKIITVRIAERDARVTIAVVDNGVGIPTENLTRIFNLGFTTRANGHGFGLHSSALAAKELGGGITVTSDGPGRGATFALDLPLKPETNAP